MRVTFGDFYGTLLRNLDEMRGRMRAAQEKLSSGKELTRPSQDPPRAAEILSIRRELESVEQYGRNAGSAIQLLEGALAATQRLQDLLGEAAVTAVAARSPRGPDTTVILTGKFESLLEGLVDGANVKDGERYLFSGYKTRTAAFAATTGVTAGGAQGITAVSYGGDSSRTTFALSDGLSVEVGIPGTSLSDSGGGDLFLGVMALRDAVATDNDAALAAAESDVARHLGGLTRAEAELGQALARAREAGGRYEAQKLDTLERISTREDADIAGVIVDLEAQRVLLDAALRAFVSVDAESLFDRL